ncbi:cytochrome b [Marivita sp. S2033]|uniref:cytochrome b n=1 Tax=Marivita sp. S2033 TaxID=3373187 RepID=UPI003982B314
MSDARFKYSRPARVLHWTMAALVLATIPVGALMAREGIAKTLQDVLYLFHKNVGVLLLILVFIRVVYRWRHPPARLPAHVPGWQRRAAAASHVALYTLLFFMPIAGYVRVKAGGFPIEILDVIGLPSLVPRSESLAETAMMLHFYGSLVIVALIAVHVAAAAQHALFRRDGVFLRMWPPFS